MTPTGSHCDTAAACPASHALPQSPVPTGEEAYRGKIVHRFTQHADAGRAEALAAVPVELHGWVEHVDLEEMHPPFRPEVAMALDVETGKAWFLRTDEPRQYPDNHGPVIYMTIDAASEERGIVADYKTGWAPDPARSRQVAAAAVALGRALGKDLIEGRILKIRENEEPERRSHVYDGYAMDRAFVSLRDVVRRVRAAEADVASGGDGKPNPGYWCKYCAAQPSCPSQKRAMELAVRISPLPREEYGLSSKGMLDAFRALEALTDRVREEVHLMARNNPIPTRDGKVWGPTEKRVRSLTADLVEKVLVDEFGDAGDIVRHETTLSALKGFLRPHAGRREVPLAGLERDILEKVRQLGGVKDKTRTEYREYRPGRKEDD